MGRSRPLTGEDAWHAARAQLGAHQVQLERSRAFIEHLDGAIASSAPAAFLGPWAVDASGVDAGGFIGPAGDPDGGLADRAGQTVDPGALGDAALLDPATVLPSQGAKSTDARTIAVPAGDGWRLVLHTQGVIDDGLEALAVVMASLSAPCFEAASHLPRAVRRRAARDERLLHRLRDRLPPDIVAESPAYRSALARAARLARHDLPALLVGETGVGKELLARAYHALGPRRDGPFVAVNCAALPEALAESLLFGHVRGAFTGAARGHDGHLEAARDGVLFLDEVGELPRPLQAKLLRALDGWTRPVGASGPERPMDTGIIAATHRDPDDPGVLRRDLRQRLGTRVDVAPLRDRPADVIALARAWVREHGSRAGFDARQLTPDAVDIICALPLGGNARELRRLVAEAFAFELTPDDECLCADHLPQWVRPTAERVASLAAQLSAFEARTVVKLLRSADSVAAAARVAGDRDQTFRKRINRLERDGFLEPSGDLWRLPAVPRRAS